MSFLVDRFRLEAVVCCVQLDGWIFVSVLQTKVEGELRYLGALRPHHSKVVG